jgi:hypothetical protein
MDGLGEGDGMGFDMKQMLPNQQQQLFGGYENSQMQGAGSMFPDDSSLMAGDETNDAKRRRIARVRTRPIYRVLRT